MYTQDISAFRQTFVDAWQKFRTQARLEPIEVQIVNIIDMHPEYHAFLTSADCITEDFSQRVDNPFLHMSLHLALHEQINTDRPTGIRATAEMLLKKYPDTHFIEHEMMSCLAKTLWEAQQSQDPPDEAKYLERLKTL